MDHYIEGGIYNGYGGEVDGNDDDDGADDGSLLVVVVVLLPPPFTFSQVGRFFLPLVHGSHGPRRVRALSEIGSNLGMYFSRC